MEKLSFMFVEKSIWGCINDPKDQILQAIPIA